MELTLWPEFHNGVAAGLRVNARVFSHRHTSPHGTSANKQQQHKQDGQDGSSPPNSSASGTHQNLPQYRVKKKMISGRQGYDGTGAVTRNWIIYNRTASLESPSFHAGVLLSLGLQGHLTVLSVTDICDYLTQGHEPTGDPPTICCRYISHSF